VPNLILLGPALVHVDRIPIYSFVIRHASSGLLLHHNFVSVLLDNLFGIQSRAGCACAGPTAQQLLGIDSAMAERFETVLREDSRLDRHHLRRKAEYSKHEMLRPGFVRLNFPFFMSCEQVDFVVEAVAFVAEHGWKVLPQV
jgi:selenocysteine lyase/cysteine desulfurase